MTDLYCYAESVPETDKDLFEDTPCEDATLHVPAASVDAYKAAEEWKEFGRIVAIGEDPSGIDGVTMESSDSLQPIRRGIYTMQGIKVADDDSEITSLPHGLYIINGRKVMVK